MIALLAAEGFGLTFRFNSATAANTLPGFLFNLPRLIFQLLVPLASLAILVRGTNPARPSDRTDDPPSASYHPWAYVVAHVIALSCFTWLTAIVLEGGARPLPSAIGWASVWACAGLTTVVTWSGIGIPPGRWLRHIGRGPMLPLFVAAFGLAIWGAGRIEARLWFPLGHTTLWAAYRLLALVADAPFYNPDTFIIGTPSFSVWVAPACSGYEGMGLVLALIGSYLWIARSRMRFPRALILLPLGLGAIWLANSARIAGLVALGSWGFRKVALGGFHSQVGWLAFNAVGLGLIALGGRWSLLRVGQSSCGIRETSNPSAPYLAPLLTIVLAAMITGAFTHGFDRLYPLRIAAAGLALWLYRRRYPELRWAPSLASVAIGVLAFALWMALEPMAPSRAAQVGPSSGPDGLPHPWLMGWLIARVVGSIVVIPLVEELAFRGYLARRIIAPDYWKLPVGTFTWTSFLVSSALFGLLHGRWLAGTAAGMLYALALYRRRELSDAVQAHATTNALIAAYVLGTGDWSLWA